MTVTVRMLIIDAWYLSGIVSPGPFQTVTGGQEGQGLSLLNGLLDLKSADLNFINYYTRYDFNFVQNQEEYLINGLVDLETLVFFNGTVRYQMYSQSRDDFFGSGRVEAISSLPFTYRAERCLGGMKIYLYFLPEAAYAAQLTGKFALANVALDDDLTTRFDGFYRQYLTYELANYMCASYNIQLQPGQAAILQKMRQDVSQISPPDMTVQKLTAFSGKPGLNWGDVNLGKGWRPGW